MKKRRHKRRSPQPPLRAEHDFRGGVRGKLHKAYHQGHAVKIHKTDGTTVVQQFK